MRTPVRRRRFLSFVYQNHMHIHVDKPTRITPNSSTCLDQIISNIPFLLQHISIMQPIGGSDHNTVTAEFGFRTEKKLCNERRVWYYNKANFDHFWSELTEHDWDPCFFDGDPDSACTKWTEDFLDIAKRCIPNKIVTTRLNDVPWYNPNCGEIDMFKPSYTGSWNLSQLDRTSIFDIVNIIVVDGLVTSGDISSSTMVPR